MNSLEYEGFKAIPITRSELKPEIIKKFEKAYKIFLIALIVVVFTFIVIAATKWLTFDTVYTQGITDTMRAKNGLESKRTYGGGGGEGRIMNAEDKNGR